MLFEACLREGMSIDQLVAEALAAAVGGCAFDHHRVTLCDT
jgi:hypothetical protein